MEFFEVPGESGGLLDRLCNNAAATYNPLGDALLISIGRPPEDFDQSEYVQRKALAPGLEFATYKGELVFIVIRDVRMYMAAAAAADRIVDDVQSGRVDPKDVIGDIDIEQLPEFLRPLAQSIMDGTYTPDKAGLAAEPFLFEEEDEEDKS